MPVTQLSVMDQTSGRLGGQSCGYHAIKNSILGLMWAQGRISDQKFEILRHDRALYNAILEATKRASWADLRNQNDVHYDLTLPNLQSIIVELINGQHDFSAQGISSEDIAAIRLDENFMATQTITYPGMVPLGLSGLEGSEGYSGDLELASFLVKAALTRGKNTLAMSLGLNNEHWVTCVLKQDAQGLRQWYFMDSQRNQKQYCNLAIRKLEAILDMDWQQRDIYLKDAYDTLNNDKLARRVGLFFDTGTGLPKPERVPGFGPRAYNAAEYFLTVDPALTMQRIRSNFQFMKEAGWLQYESPDIQQRIFFVYMLAEMMMKNIAIASPEVQAVVNAELPGIIQQLKGALPLNKRISEVVEFAEDELEVIEQALEVLPEVQYTPEEIEAEVTKIKDNRFDIKGHMDTLLPIVLMEEQRSQDKIAVVPNLVNEDSIAAELKKKYDGKDYVVMMYAHKPHSSSRSPTYPDDPAAHTSVLLCKVENGVIRNTMNIDGYDFPGYVDIMGVRPGAQANPHIQQRMVIKAKNALPGEPSPIQSPSWKNMNCSLYALTITQQLIQMHESQPDTLANVFNPRFELGAEVAHFLLSENIKAGMVGKYLQSMPSGEFISDRELAAAYHNDIREQLAAAFQAQHTQKAALVAEQEAEVVVNQEAVLEMTPEVDPELVVNQEAVVEVTPEVDPKPVVNQEAVLEVTSEADPELVVNQESVLEVSPKRNLEPVVHQKPDSETMVHQEAVLGVTQEAEPALDATGSPEISSTHDESSVDKDRLNAQSKAAREAVNEGAPKPTEGFVARFVNSIKAAFNAVVDWVAQAARAIGIIQS